MTRSVAETIARGAHALGLCVLVVTVNGALVAGAVSAVNEGLLYVETAQYGRLSVELRHIRSIHPSASTPAHYIGLMPTNS